MALVAHRILTLVFALLATGAALGGELWFATGSVLLGVASMLYPVVSGVPVGVRRDVRQKESTESRRSVRAHNAIIRTAAAWLMVAGALLVVDGTSRLAGGGSRFPIDPIRHVVTTGYLTLLIMGVGARMLPGFARQRVRPSRLLVLVGVTGNVAALCRVAPPLVTAAGGAGPFWSAMLGLSGVFALIAVGCFTRHVWPMLAT